MQLQRLNELIREVQDRPFYRERQLGDRYPLESLDDLASLPLLTKDQVLGDAANCLHETAPNEWNQRVSDDGVGHAVRLGLVVILLGLRA
jgi:hypothetical protein